MARSLLTFSSSRLGVLSHLFASLALVACGGGATSDESAANADAGLVDDTAVMDASEAGVATDSGSPVEDASVGFDCSGKPDGTECGGGSICLRGACAGSSCGDGFVNAAAGEDCEDDNDASGDGCSLCKFDCKSDTDCANGNTCDGAEKCNTTTHRCEAGTAATEGTSCSASGGGSGSCKGGLCVSAGCGNGVKEAGEDCDDANADDTDGCTRLCKFTCSTSADCDDGNKCNGAEACDSAAHKCKPGAAVICSPKSGCTGTCEPSTGACSYPDADKDGVACDKDCNDADPAMFPGAYECKDGKDNDCNAGTSDSTAPSCICYRDNDKDGFAIVGAATVSAAGACPDGYTRRAPVLGDASSIDCSEVNASAYPGQTAWFTSSYCGKWGVVGGALTCTEYSYDYNCSGAAEKRYSATSATSCPGATNLLVCVSRSGWIGAVPACGAKGTFRSCSWSASGCTGTETSRAQECR